jgi:hypothetical protein
VEAREVGRYHRLRLSSIFFCQTTPRIRRPIFRSQRVKHCISDKHPGETLTISVRFRLDIAGGRVGTKISYRNSVDVSIATGSYRKRFRKEVFGSFSVVSRHFQRSKASSTVPPAARAPLLTTSPPQLLSLPRRPARYALSALTPRRRMSDAENTSFCESGTVVVPNRCDIVTGSSSAVGAPVVAQRKWTNGADILLLKEVAARKAHIPVFGKAMETYSAIAARAITVFVPSIKPTQFCSAPLLFATATAYAVARC